MDSLKLIVQGGSGIGTYYSIPETVHGGAYDIQVSCNGTSIRLGGNFTANPVAAEAIAMAILRCVRITRNKAEIEGALPE